MFKIQKTLCWGNKLSRHKYHSADFTSFGSQKWHVITMLQHAMLTNQHREHLSSRYLAQYGTAFQKAV